MPSKPDIVLVLADDMGFSDIGCYGGEVSTPNLDRLAAYGARLTQFYNTARCSPSRASLLTGLHPHQTGIGILNYDDSPDGYPGTLNDSCVTIAEALRPAGYGTYLSGKWHLSSELREPCDAWPTRRGFDRFYGTLAGAGSYFQPATLTRDEQNIEHEATAEDYYFTDAISDNAVSFVRDHDATRPDDPMFLYVAYTAPHWPLHALEEDIAKYAGRFSAGWDSLRQERLRRLVADDIIDEDWALTDRDPSVPAWEDAEHKEWEALRMAVYAAQIDRMDQGIGRIIDELDAAGRLDNTLFVFLSDNGGCAEEMPPDTALDFVTAFVDFAPTTREGDPVIPGNGPDVVPGPESTYATYGTAWANLSNTPFREYKHWIHEGGIATPFVVHWPEGLGSTATVRTNAHQLPDVMATVLEAAGADYPERFDGRAVLPLEGHSMLPTLRGEPGDPGRTLFWEHEGNAGARRGKWKLVRKYGLAWELYDMERDRTELHDVAAEHPGLVRELADAYETWAGRCGVLPREQVLKIYAERGNGLPT
ncbi:arylsulfatase [Amycolatopsis acidiphila]|uniref:Arylsulfatase n=1 Tax=Amycolatopsis acidiphila TaxID=715473 RepID=A0A558AL72_9PSEU|nr:arylsulfatase [Amycolatopsis acidiphila]TVT25004.1 arylsulfatase [Amycolatopsis acidiphila]UIJ57488.1 arylsulfatase [Amycolatopsis acidiphila]